jgi:molybdopterin-containing oxidoreductase family iron-sulfur binding subunit
MNLVLGNIGNTITYHEALDAELPDTRGLAGLVQAIRDGEVSTLLVLGGNPAHNAPADLDFAGAISDVTNVVRLGERVDETSRLASWHLPQAHFLEAWGDVRAADGTPSVIQPLIEPLFGGKSAVELLGLAATGAEAAGYELVRETWRGLLPAETFDAAWNRVLHDGLLAGSELPAASPGIVLGVGREIVAELTAASVSGQEGLALVLAASPAVFDGRWANNAWLQELPDAITKLTWGNAAQLSPATAAGLGVKNEDVARLSYGERSLELPVWIVPGQADDTVVVHLGYGRASGGRVADGVGTDAYPLRTVAALHDAPGASLVGTGVRYELAQTQDHGSLEEPDLGQREGRRRPLVQESSLAGYREDPEFAKHHAVLPVEESMWKEFEYTESPQWGMTIDLNSCTGCNACVIACQSENNIPVVGKDQVRRGREMHWIRLDRYFDGEVSDPSVVFQAVPCQMCENAPCEQVCPVSATVHDKQGLNLMVYNRCIGTRYCSNNCPYKVRRFNYYNFTKDTPEVTQLAKNPEVTVRSRGVMEKCTYCLQRISAAQIDARLGGREVRDGEIQTACQQACPAQAIQFGDILDRNSAVAGMKRQDRNYTLLDELYTKPRTSYLAKLRNPNPELADG